MADTPLPNDTAARSDTGEIIDVRDAPAPKPEGEASPEPKAEPSVTETPDGKTVLTKPADDAKGKDAPKSSAPDAYAEFKAPDGYTISKELLDAATPIFKELGLSQEAAQRLVTLQAEQMIAAAKAPEATMNTMRSEWQTATLADPEIKTAGIDTVKADIGRALSALGDTKLASDFKSAMDLTGAGDNPAFVKTFWKLAQLVGEGKHVTGAGPSPAGQQAPGAKPPSAAKALYPNLS